MSNKLLDLYKSVLNCAGMAYDSEGFVSVKMGEERSPARTSDGKQIVLPTQEQLMNGDRTNRVIFHPLSENIMRSAESEIISKLRSVFNIRLNYTFAAISRSLLTLCASIADHRKLTPDQSEMLSAIKDVDEKTIVAFTSMMLHSLKDSPERGFVNIYLKRKAIFHDKTYARGGVVTFPLYAELQKDQDKYYGVKLRAKDKAAFLDLYRYIFPGIDEVQAYNRGSNSDVAPFLDALMNTVMGVASKYNDVIELFGSIIDSHEALIFDYEWVESFDNLQDLVLQIRQIPSQVGNEGKHEAMQITPTQAPQQSLVYHQPAAQQQVYNPVNTMPVSQPQLIVTENGVTFDSFLRVNPQIAAVTIGNNSMYSNGIPGNDPSKRIPGFMRESQQPIQSYGQQAMYQQNTVPQMMPQQMPQRNNWGGNL